MLFYKIEVNLVYVLSCCVLSGWKWLNLVVKGTLNLRCTARVPSEGRSNPKTGREANIMSRFC